MIQRIHLRCGSFGSKICFWILIKKRNIPSRIKTPDLDFSKEMHPKSLSSKEEYISSLWWLTVFKSDFFGFCVELNLSSTEARRKATKKKWYSFRLGPCKAVLGIYELFIARLQTKPYDSLSTRKVSFHWSEKTSTQHSLSLFPLF